MKMLSFTHPHAIPNPFDVISSVGHKSRDVKHNIHTAFLYSMKADNEKEQRTTKKLTIKYHNSSEA